MKPVFLFFAYLYAFYNWLNNINSINQNKMPKQDHNVNLHEELK